MSEKITHNAYLLPAEFMEPQRPVTPKGYSVVDRKKIESADLRKIPASATPVFMQSATGEKAVRGGENSEFRQTQDAAYAEREKNRNVWLERSLGDVALEAVADISDDDSMNQLLDPNFDAEALPVEGAAVRPERTEEEVLEVERKRDDAAAWQANVAAYERQKNDRE